MSDPEQTETSTSPPDEQSERGTAVLGLLFIAALAGMWAVVYFIMLERGGV